MTTRLLPSLITAATLVAASSANAATITSTYDLSTEVGGQGTLLSTDGWTGTGIANWITNGFGGDFVARNGSGDSTIFRTNDAGFSFVIPADATQVILEIDARSGGGFFQTGISVNGTTLLGLGGDYGTGDKFYILDGGTRRFESAANATGDTIKTLRLVFDVATNTADLILNPQGANTLLINDVALTTNIASLSTANQLFLRSGSIYAGPSEFNITTVSAVPEPSTYGLLGAGALAAVAFVRRRRKQAGAV